MASDFRVACSSSHGEWDADFHEFASRPLGKRSPNGFRVSVKRGGNGAVKGSLSHNYFFFKKEPWCRYQKTNIDILSTQLTPGGDSASLGRSVLICEMRLDLSFHLSFIHVETLTLTSTWF